MFRSENLPLPFALNSPHPSPLLLGERGRVRGKSQISLVKIQPVQMGTFLKIKITKPNIDWQANF
jgi:hypothetical protein